MSYTELTVWTRGIIMDKEGRDVVNSVAMAGRKEGRYTQAMENYVDNPDRTNAPTRKYCRLSDSEIENALTYENENPNIVVLVEGAVVEDVYFDPGEDAERRQRFVQPRDHFELLQQPLACEAVSDLEAR